MTMELKPQNFHLDGKEWAYNAYITGVRKAVNTSTIKNDLKAYLIALLDYTSGSITKEKMENIAYVYRSSPAVVPMLNFIKKFYGEVLGPIWTIKNNVFGDTPIKSKAKIFHPTAENEPLTDYEVIYPKNNRTKPKRRQTQHSKTKNDRAKKIVNNLFIKNRISAKSGTTTNTVKATDILYLIGERKNVYAEWIGSIQYEVLEILDSNNAAVGPLKAIQYLQEQGELPKNYLPDAIINKLINLFDINTQKNALALNIVDVLTEAQVQNLKPIIQHNSTLSGRYLTNSGIITTFKNEPLIVGYICVAAEYRIQELTDSKKTPSGLLFHEIFGDAVSGLINYVTFNIDKNGMPVWTSQGAPEMETVDGFIRSKNTLGTRLIKDGMKDKLGFQPVFH
jgi:hypothetical protein